MEERLGETTWWSRASGQQPKVLWRGGSAPAADGTLPGCRRALTGLPGGASRHMIRVVQLPMRAGYPMSFQALMRSITIAGALATVVVSACSTSGERRSPVELGPGRAAPCGRECLTTAIDRYLEALAARDPSRLPLAEFVRFTENGRELRLGDGLWRTAGALGAYRVHAIDPDAQSAAVQTILADGQSQVQLLVRLKLREGRIAEVETLVAREGDTCCWAPERLDGLGPIFGQPVPAAERATREELVAAADAYFTALHTAGTAEYRPAPVAEGMDRFENGKQTTNVVGGNRIIRRDARSQLDSAMFGRIDVVNRRYPVVDTQHGTVLGIVVFEYPDSNRPSEIISELFKITRGEIREIRAVMVRQPSSGWE